MTRSSWSTTLRAWMQIPDDLERWTRGATARQLDTETEPGGMTLRETVHHIVEANLVAASMLIAARGKPGTAYDWTWLVPNQVLDITQTSTVPNGIGVVGFAFDDGLIPLPGQGPILLDPLTFSPFLLAGILPSTWLLAFQGVVIPPGTRLVMFGVGLFPSSSYFIGGNQIWFQL